MTKKRVIPSESLHGCTSHGSAAHGRAGRHPGAITLLPRELRDVAAVQDRLRDEAIVERIQIIALGADSTPCALTLSTCAPLVQAEAHAS